MPFPLLPETTLETAPDVPVRFSPIVFPDEDAATKIPSPRLPNAAPVRLKADVVAVEGDVAGLQRDPVAAGVIDREGQQP